MTEPHRDVVSGERGLVVLGGACIAVSVVVVARLLGLLPRVMTTVSTAGLAVSAVTIIASLPVTTRVGGLGPFLSELFA